MEGEGLGLDGPRSGLVKGHVTPPTSGTAVTSRPWLSQEHLVGRLVMPSRMRADTTLLTQLNGCARFLPPHHSLVHEQLAC